MRCDSLKTPTGQPDHAKVEMGVSACPLGVRCLAFKAGSSSLHIFVMGILNCVFFNSRNGRCCRLGAETIAVQDRQILPLWAGITFAACGLASW